MTPHRLLTLALTAFILVLTAGTASVAAQGALPDTLHACFVPGSGTIYRIKATGLPTNCLAPAHVAFQWNAGGSEGPVGPTGATGVAGTDGSGVTLAELPITPATQPDRAVIQLALDLAESYVAVHSDG